MADIAVASGAVSYKYTPTSNHAAGSTLSSKHDEDSIPRIPIIGNAGDITMASLAADSDLARYIATSTPPASDLPDLMRSPAEESDTAGYTMTDDMLTARHTASNASSGTYRTSNIADDLRESIAETTDTASHTTSRSPSVSTASWKGTVLSMPVAGEDLNARQSARPEVSDTLGYRWGNTLHTGSPVLDHTKPGTHLATSGTAEDNESISARDPAPTHTQSPPTAKSAPSSNASHTVYTGTSSPARRQTTQYAATTRPAITSTRPAKYPAPAVPLSEIVIKTFYKGLRTLDHFLTVAETHAQARDMDADDVYPDARLADDMLPFTFQVQNATTTVRKTLSRAALMRTQIWPDTERTMADLHNRIEMALDLLNTVQPKQINNRLDDLVEL
jgi:hypothetical protein